MNLFVRQAMGYTFASVIAFLVDLTALWLLVNFSSCQLLSASTLSFLAGAFVAYEISIRVAFTQQRRADLRTERVAFILIGAFGLMLNAAVIVVAAGYLQLNYLLAKCLAAGLTFSCNFVLRRHFLFMNGPRLLRGL